jgi:hypothetical protein
LAVVLGVLGDFARDSALDRIGQECRGSTGRRCSLSRAYQSRSGIAGVGLRGGLGLRTGKTRAEQEVRIHAGFFADLVVEDQAIVEIKAVENVAPVHKKQLLTYLKLADKRLGLLLNFNVVLIKNGITRIVNGLKE